MSLTSSEMKEKLDSYPWKYSEIDHENLKKLERIVDEDDISTFLNGKTVERDGIPGASLSKQLDKYHRYDIAACFAKQSVWANRIVDWMLQNKKEKFDLEAIIHQSISLLAPSVEHWMEQMRKEKGQDFKFDIFFESLANALRMRGGKLNEKEQYRFLEIMNRLIDISNVLSFTDICRFMTPLIEGDGKLFEKILFLSINKYVLPEQKKEFLLEVLRAYVISREELNRSAQKLFFYDILGRLLLKVKIGEYAWIKHAMINKDVEVFKRLLKGQELVLNPEDGTLSSLSLSNLAVETATRDKEQRMEEGEAPSLIFSDLTPDKSGVPTPSQPSTEKEAGQKEEDEWELLEKEDTEETGATRRKKNKI